MVLLSASQFFAGSPLTGPEQQAIINEARSDFAKDPQTAAAEIAQLRQLGTALSQMQDPLKLVEARQLALFQLYQAHQSGQGTVTSQVILSKAAPLAVAPQNKLLLLTDDLQGMAQFLSLVRQSQGGQPLSSTELEAFQRSAVSGFAQLPAEAQAMLVSGRILWATVSHNLQQMNQTQQAQFQQQLSRQVPTDNSMSWDTYHTMSQMSRAQHLNTLNILENIGGTGNYWTVEERPGW